MLLQCSSKRLRGTRPLTVTIKMLYYHVIYSPYTMNGQVRPDERSYLKAELFVFPTTMDCPVILSPVMFPPCLFLGTIQE